MKIMTARGAAALLAGAFMLAVQPAAAQSPEAHDASPRPLANLPSLTGEHFSLASEATGRTYHIHVRVPDGYDPAGGEAYPVAYVLDGDSLWPILAANHLFLTYDDGLPEAIVVGLAYGSFSPHINARSIDFMPPGSDGEFGQEAGAPDFARFLKDELIPVVEARWRADPERRILFGQSRSGSFVLYSAFTDPDLFMGRIASNPAFAPTEAFFHGEPATATRDDLKQMIASGEHDRPDLREAALRWGEAWEDRAGTPWQARVETIPGGTHAANSTDAWRAGLRWFFTE
jgi:predicted alpha/beta superfamily hydrolase